MRLKCSILIAILRVHLPTVRADELPGIQTFVQLPSPAGNVSFVPQLQPLRNGDVAASWLEERPDKTYLFRLSVLHGEKWGPVRTIATGPDISHFSADLPGVVEAADGNLLAYWEVSDHTAADKYATAIQVAASKDGGALWSTPVRPYPDSVQGQHSFLSVFPLGPNLELVWLDAQVQTHSGPDHSSMGAIGLRNVELDREMRIRSDRWVTPIACECCPTSAAITAEGPVVVFRGRAESPGTKATEVDPARATVRDIQIARLQDGKWTSPRYVHEDNWVINACPDNGPAIDSEGRDVVVAWWTAAHNQPSVYVAFSSDAGLHFGEPVRVDRARGEGQVTVAWNSVTKEALVGWLEGHETWARIVSPDRRSGQPVSLGPSPSHARLPHWIATPKRTLVAWTALENNKRSVRFGYLEASKRKGK